MMCNQELNEIIFLLRNIAENIAKTTDNTVAMTEIFSTILENMAKDVTQTTGNTMVLEERLNNLIDNTNEINNNLETLISLINQN